MTAEIDTFKTFIETQLLSSPFMLLLVMLNLTGIALWKWRKFNNDWISPLKVLAGGSIYPFIADPSKIYFTTNNPMFANFIIGCLIGGIAVVFHPLCIRLIAKVEKMGRKYLNGDLDKELGDRELGEHNTLGHGSLNTPNIDKIEKEQKDGN